MEKLRPYFALSGRTSRRDYWQTVLLLVVISAIIWVAGLALRMVSPIGLVLLALLILPFAASFCLSVRRLHDRNKSGWWLLVFSVLPSVLSGMGDSVSIPAVTALFGLISLPFSIWGFVEMGCLRGTPGSNKYGDDPLASSTAEVFA